MKIYTLEDIKKMKVEEAFWKINGQIISKDYEPYEEKTLGEPSITYNGISLFNLGDNVGIWFEIKDELTNKEDCIVEKRIDLHFTKYDTDYNYLITSKREEEKRIELREKYGDPGVK